MSSLRTPKYVSSLIIATAAFGGVPRHVDSRCAALGVNEAALDTLAAEIARAARDTALTRYTVDAACMQVRYRARKLTVVTLTDDGPHLDGGVALLSPHSSARDAYVYSYPGAEDPISAGAQRFAFSYQSGRGSGFLETTFVVMCGIAEDNWVECFKTVRDQSIGITGYLTSDTIAARGMRYERRSTVAVVGDTAILRSTVSVQTYGEKTPRTLQLVDRATLPVVH